MTIEGVIKIFWMCKFNSSIFNNRKSTSFISTFKRVVKRNIFIAEHSDINKVFINIKKLEDLKFS